MEKKLISVIIPCYNAEKYLKECLESLINQTIGFENIEVIIIDDASTDNSLKCMKTYEEKYPDNILIVSLEENEGQANARNIGMHYVTADYFTFVDADDWLELDAYEKLLKPVEKYQCDLLQCGMIERIKGQEPLVTENKWEGSTYFDSIEGRKTFLEYYGFNGMIGCSIYRTEWIRGLRLEFKKFTKYEDNYWEGLIIYHVQSYYGMKECLYNYRILSDSNSHNRNDEGHFIRLEVELEKLNYYIETGLFAVYYREIRNQFLNTFYVNTLHTIFCKFDVIPIERIQVMQKTVKEIFPDYLEYCRESTRFINPVLTVAFNFPINVWEDYKKAYLAWVERGEEEGIAQIYLGLRKALGLG